MQRVLSFEEGPSLSVPLRFFLTAPLFAIAAAAVMLWYGPAALLSRWAMPTLAATHLMTLGFLAMNMVGALMQILPVVAGVNLLAPKRTASVVFLLLGAGTVALSAAFLFFIPALFGVAGLLLGGAFLWLLVSIVPGLRRCTPGSAAATVNTIRLALMSLLVTVSLGLTLAVGLGWSLSWPVLQITDAHAAWGLVGWVGLLLMGVGFQVIPMFQATPVYPRAASFPLASLLAAMLAAWSLTALFDGEWVESLRSVLGFIILGSVFGFAVVTLWLLQRRRRPAAEATTLFWRVSMASLAACAPVYLSHLESRPLLLGILLIAGCGFSAVNGMLYKIVPFLLWYDLQSRSGLDRKSVPSIRLLSDDARARQQFWLHLASLLLLVGAAMVPEFLARAAALMFGMSCLRLWWNLMKACLAYRRAATGTSPAMAAA
jgi:hypothetical protein